MRGAFTLWMLILVMSLLSPPLAGFMAGIRIGIGEAFDGIFDGACIGGMLSGFWYTVGRRLGVYIQKKVKPERQELAFAAMYIAAFLSTILACVVAAAFARGS